MGSFVKKTKEFKRLYEVDDTEGKIKTKKNAFGAWSAMFFMRIPDKIKYGKLIHDLSIQYAFNNNQYPKTLQEAVDVIRKEKFKVENNNDKLTHKSRIKWRW